MIMAEDQHPPPIDYGVGSSEINTANGTVASTVNGRHVRASTIQKPRNRASVVGGGRTVTREDIHNVFKSSTRDLKIITDEQVARVQLMHEKFTEGAEFSFNYNTMLLVASVLAGLGLASNSTATIVASMLVSPIMGPVMGMVRLNCYFIGRANRDETIVGD